MAAVAMVAVATSGLPQAAVDAAWHTEETFRHTVDDKLPSVREDGGFVKVANSPFGVAWVPADRRSLKAISIGSEVNVTRRRAWLTGAASYVATPAQAER